MATAVETQSELNNTDLDKTLHFQKKRRLSDSEENPTIDSTFATQELDSMTDIDSAIKSRVQQHEKRNEDDCDYAKNSADDRGYDVPNTQWLATDTPSLTHTDSLERPPKLARTTSIHPVRMNIENSVLKETTLPIGEEHYVKIERFLNETDRRYPVVTIQRNGNCDLKKVFILHLQEYEQMVNHLKTVLKDGKDMEDWDITMGLKGSEQRRKFNTIKITSVDTFDAATGTCHPRKIDIRYWFMKKEADTEKNIASEWLATKAGIRISKEDAKCLIDLYPVLKERTSTLFNLNYTIELVGDLLSADFNEKVPKNEKKSRIFQFTRYLSEMTMDGLRTILKNECRKSNAHKYLVNRKLSINDMFRYLKSIDGKSELVKYI